MGPRSWLERLKRALDRPRCGRLIVLVAAALTLPSLFSGFGADDHHFRMVLSGFRGLPELARPTLDLFTFAPGDAAENAAWTERGLLPWWSAPTIRLSFFRPLAALSHALDHRLWPDATILVHAHSILWYVLLAAVVVAFYRRFLVPPWVAALAALLFLVDDARLLSVAWAATRNTSMSSLGAVLALLAHDRWRRDGWRPGALLAPLALALGLLCGEAAVGVWGYLAAYAAFLDRARLGQRATSLIPHALVTLAWLVAYRALGHGVAGSALYLDPAGEPGPFLAAVVLHLPVLFLDQLGGTNPTLSALLSPGWAALYATVGALFTALVAWAVWPLLRRDRTLRFFAAGALLSALPACATLPQNRVLFLVGLGAMALIARGLAAWLERAPELFDGRRFTTPLGLLAPLAVPLHLLLAPLIGVTCVDWMAVFEHDSRRVSDSLPHEAAIAGETVVIVNLPSDVLLHGIPYLRSSLGQPTPRRMQALYAGIGAIEVVRLDARTLEISADTTFVSWPWAQVFRSPETNPFVAGEVVRLSFMAAEIRAIDGAGRPTRVRFHFDRPLESAADRWLSWSAGRLVPFEAPPVGGSRRFPAIKPWRLLRQSVAEFVRSGRWKRAWRLDG